MIYDKYSCFMISDTVHKLKLLITLILESRLYMDTKK